MINNYFIQPPLTLIDEARSVRCRSLLDNVIQDINQSESKLSSTQEQFLVLEDQVAAIGKFLLRLQLYYLISLF